MVKPYADWLTFDKLHIVTDVMLKNTISCCTVLVHAHSSYEIINTYTIARVHYTIHFKIQVKPILTAGYVVSVENIPPYWIMCTKAFAVECRSILDRHLG